MSRCAKHPDRKIRPTVTDYADGSKSLLFHCDDPECAKREAWGKFIPPKGERIDQAGFLAAVVEAVEAAP